MPGEKALYIYAEAVEQSIIGMKCGNFWNLGFLKSHLLAFEALYNKHWSCTAVSAGPIPLPLYNMCSYVHLYQSYLVYFS